MLENLKSFLTDCANAIREKSEDAGKMRPDKMAENILKIVSRPPSPSGEYHHIVDETGSKPQVLGNTLFGTIQNRRHYSDSYITEIVLMSDVTTIPEYFAAGTSKLNVVEIQGLVDSIGSYAFQNSNITKLANKTNHNVFPKNATVVPDYCFKNCRNLTAEGGIRLHDDITKIGTSAFDISSGGAGSTIYVGEANDMPGLPANLQTIGNSAFSYQQLAITTIPEKVETIGANAFSYNLDLSTLTFKGTPTSIATTAFSGCSFLTTINVPWGEGEVAGAPWGAASATINYNQTV